MSQDIEITIGVDAVAKISTREDFDRVEIFCSDPDGSNPTGYTVSNPQAGVRKLNILSLLTGRMPGRYKMRVVGYKGSSAEQGNVVYINFDPIAVNSNEEEPKAPQLSIESFGGFGD